MDLESLQKLIDTPPRRILFSRLPSDPGAAVAARKLNFPSRPDSHFHRELHLVLQGERFFRVGARVFHLRPGDALFIDRWEEHNQARPAPSGTEAPVYVSAILHGHDPMWWHTVRETPAGGFALVAEQVYVILPEALSVFFGRMVDSASACANAREMAVRLATAVNAALAAYAIALREAEETGGGGAMPLAAIRRRIAETRGAGCTMRELAALAGMSPSTFGRRFRAAYGYSVRDEVRRVREEFVQMAVVCGESQKEIAAKLGFSAVSNYSRWLRSHNRRSNQIEDIVRTYIEHRHGANCSLSELAERFGYSASRLVHLYKSRTGESIGDAVRRARRDYFRAHPAFSDAKMSKALGFLSVKAYRHFVASL